jgi:hypothetical protein
VSDDRKSPVQRPVGFRSLCHSASPVTGLNYHFSE